MTVNSTVNRIHADCADYNDIAWFYDRHWSSHYHPWAVQVLHRTLLDGLRPGARILDVCCGNGVLAAILCDLGYRVTGVDLSAEMLRHACRNAPAAQFVHADVRTCALRPVFDAAISTFDSLNHILSPDQLRSAFSNIRQALKPGATFVFDLNLNQAYTIGWKSSSATVDEEHACFIRGSYDSRQRIATTNVTLFGRSESWHRSDITLLQRYYPQTEVIRLLRSAGFRQACALNAKRDLGVSGHFSDGRAVFVATAGSGESRSPKSRRNSVSRECTCPDL